MSGETISATEAAAFLATWGQDAGERAKHMRTIVALSAEVERQAAVIASMDQEHATAISEAQVHLLSLLAADLDGFARYDEAEDEWEQDPAAIALMVLNRVLSLPVDQRAAAIGLEGVAS